MTILYTLIDIRETPYFAPALVAALAASYAAFAGAAHLLNVLLGA